MSGPIPARVDATVKLVLLGLIDDALDAGWRLTRICGVLELERGRAWRWRHRDLHDTLDDAVPGGNPVHGLLDWEEAEIVALFDEWGPVDLSHRKLAHRGSYLDRVFVSPASVDRVLARNGLALAGTPRPGRSVKKAWPDWVEWRANQLWCWDATHFMACTAAQNRLRDRRCRVPQMDHHPALRRRNLNPGQGVVPQRTRHRRAP